MVSKYILNLSITFMVILAYYKYGKLLIIKLSQRITRYFKLAKYFPGNDIEGVIELAMIATSHVAFCLVLLWLVPVHLPHRDLSLYETVIFLIYGVLLGIGCMGVSALFCKIAIQIIDSFKKNNSYDLKSWLTVGRGGWIKHHLQSIEILPIYLSLIVLTMQVGSEEIIFRGIMLNYFIIFGKYIAFFTSLSSFILMQAFLMNKWQAAIFPMIGAAIMGFIHSIAYINVPILWPLIIAHVTFFIFSVI